MILQNIIFPKDGICTETELYYHKIQGTIHQERDSLILSPETEISFLSYFNSFSCDKWKDYTRVQNVDVVVEAIGDYEVSLWRATIDTETPNRECIEKKESLQGKCHLSFDCTKPGTIYYTLKAKQEITLFHSHYETSLQEENNITLAIGICTYRREEFVEKTLDTLQAAFINNSDSPLYGKLYVYVSDNGNSLPAGDLSNDYIQVMPNKNAGGAGGFGRCMLEARKQRERYGLTHILLMDDDIILEPESILRTFTLLTSAKESYSDAMIGGGLLRLDVPYMQHANGEQWKGGEIAFTKRGYDLRQEAVVLKNEEKLPIDYNGWWFSCVPLGENFRGMPLPVFIHRDDIEYGLRFQGKIMTLNGIGVWHDAFDHRRASSLEYYNMRNSLITCAIHEPDLSKFHLLKNICRHLIGLMLHYREEDQLLILRGLEDFCKGINFLKNTDPVALHQEIMKMGYQMQDVTKQLKELHAEDYYTPPRPEHLYDVIGFSKSHLPTINGWLLPGKKGTLPLPMGAHPDRLYRYKNALLYEPDTGKGFFVKRKRKNLFITFGRCCKVWRLLSKNYSHVIQDYKEHGKELLEETFWEKYLH